MFEVDGVYANRKGKYKVLAINPPKMSVRYEDGTLAELNINVQERIWENILVEQQAQTAKEESKRRKGLQSARHFIKVISIPSEDEFMFPGWQERVVMDAGLEPAIQIKAGDRLIYYAIEAQVFFAVATITGKGFEANPIDYFYPTDKTSARFFPVDMDASAPTRNWPCRANRWNWKAIRTFKRLNLNQNPSFPSPKMSSNCWPNC